MFKFLKSKKGFTLVELMIVVVIMAILVAVAVPIYSAVTKNARKKTCIGNQREIISSVGNWLMLQDDTTINGTFGTKGGNDAPAWDTFALKKGDTATTDYDSAIKALFKTIPVCPDKAANISVTIKQAAANTDEKATVTTKCENGADSAEHVVPGVQS